MELWGGDHLLPAPRADLLLRPGRDDEATAAYREALDLVTHDAERRSSHRRPAGLSDHEGRVGR
ncbi:transcriptional regulator [Streptomyces sp. NPDC056437]|uniref:transcriptional regulator n=1 Tax=Streptomyces sp. NPDC056437 TaxID=3345816 RepID=UPI00368D8740